MPTVVQLLSSTLAVGDGAMGTMLQAQGLPVGKAPELWNLEHPDLVASVHRAYAKAGAQWLQTNTFGGTRSRLASSGLASEVQRVNREAVRCARAGGGLLPVLGSVGPSGGQSAEWEHLYAEQCEALAAAGVDGYIVETIVSLPEGVAAVRSAMRSGAGPVLACVTPEAEGSLLDGSSIEAAAKALAKAGAAVVGVNCGDGPMSLLAAAKRLLAAAEAPVMAAPNAGLPEVTPSGLRYALRPDGFAQAAIEFQEIGVRMFAGCCGTTPECIRAAVAAFGVPDPGERP